MKAVETLEDQTLGDPQSSNRVRHSWGRLAVPATACGIAGLYLIYVAHFAVNAPMGDEWGVVELVAIALHGHLSFGALWTQHLESRMLFPNLLFVGAGFIDHYDVRSIIILSALIYVASFFLLLGVIRAYIGRALTVLPTLILGLVWFSLAACFDALWGFQIAWYLVATALVCLLYVFLVAKIHGNAVALALGIVAAVLASYSSLQGLILWPVGLILLLWETPWGRRTFAQAGVWLGAGVVTTGLYLWHFNFGATIALCPPNAECTLRSALTHPALSATYGLRLIGNVVPSTTGRTGLIQELLGVILCIAAAAVIVQSFRERGRVTRIPLPLALVVFAVLNDATIVVGRVGFGSPGDLEYTLPQVLLLSGIAIYAWGHLPPELLVSAGGGRRVQPRAVGYMALGTLLVFQALLSTNFGFAEGAHDANLASDSARLVVNVTRVPPAQAGCYESALLAGDIVSTKIEEVRMRPIIAVARADQLSMFDPGDYQAFRADGPPSLPRCVHVATRSPEVTSKRS